MFQSYWITMNVGKDRKGFAYVYEQQKKGGHKAISYTYDIIDGKPKFVGKAILYSTNGIIGENKIEVSEIPLKVIEKIKNKAIEKGIIC